MNENRCKLIERPHHSSTPSFISSSPFRFFSSSCSCTFRPFHERRRPFHSLLTIKCRWIFFLSWRWIRMVLLRDHHRCLGTHQSLFLFRRVWCGLNQQQQPHDRDSSWQQNRSSIIRVFATTMIFCCWHRSVSASCCSHSRPSAHFISGKTQYDDNSLRQHYKSILVVGTPSFVVYWC